MGEKVDTFSTGTSFVSICEFYCINLVHDIIIRNDNIITTSCALVLIKNGKLITLAIKCISAPNVADICKTMKYAVTIKNDPITLPNVSICTC